MVGTVKIHSPRTPGSATSRGSVVRTHSPYCEATGPIVQEGFVASRISALQSVQRQRTFKRSHSRLSLTPCPTIKATSIYEPPTTPVSRAPQSLVPTPQCLNIIPSDCLPSKPPSSPIPPPSQVHQTWPDEHSLRIKFPVPRTAANHKHDVLDGSKMEEIGGSSKPRPEEKVILSPRAIPSQLAEPSFPWDSSMHGESATGLKCHKRSLRQRRSVADKLGAMVEHGWIGCDVFGKAFNDREGLEVNSPTFHIRKSRKTYRRSSTSDRGFPALEKDDKSSNRKLEALSKELGSADDPYCEANSRPNHLLYSAQPKKPETVQGVHSTNATVLRRSTTNATGSSESDKEPPRATEKRRAWTLHHPHCSNGDGGHRVKLRTLSNHAGIERQPFQPAHSGPQEPKRAKGVQHHHYGRFYPDIRLIRQLSPPTSEALSSRLSSSTAHQSSKSESRATSILGNLFAGKWLKMIVVDKKPQLRDLSRRSSAPIVGTMENIHTMAECGHGIDETDPVPLEHTAKPDPVARGAAEPDSMQDTPRPAVSQPEERRACPTPVSTAQKKTTPRDLTTSLMDPVSRSGQQQSSKQTQYSTAHSQASVHLAPAESRPGESPLSMQSDDKANGKGIKRVQVIVNLDGADDLIVEARLERKTKGEK